MAPALGEKEKKTRRGSSESTHFAYLEGLTITQGPQAGERLAILPWQRKFLRGAFGSGVREAALSVARGNGKSTLVAAIACAALDGPLARPRAETVVVASSFAQGRIIFDHVRGFLADKLADRASWRVWDSANMAMIENRATGARLRCLGSDPARAHGLAPVLVLADEPAQWPESTGERMIAALRTARGKIEGSRMIVLGTRPASSTHFFQTMLSGAADFAMSFAASPDDPIGRKTTWARANPSMRFMPDLESAIRSESIRAKLDPGERASFAALRLNQGVSDVAESVLVNVDTWRGAVGNADRFGPVVWGIDLGTSAAMSAVAAYWPQTGRCECIAAFGDDPDLARRGEIDGVGRLYVQCQAAGDLMLTAGRATNVPSLIRAAMSRYGRPAGIACDRWRQAELFDALKISGVPVCPVDFRGQGFKDGGEDVRTFRRGILEGKVVPVESILLTSAMSEARVLVDPAGNAKLAKASEAGRRKRARDDAAAAAILAVSLGLRRQPRASTLRVALAG